MIKEVVIAFMRPVFAVRNPEHGPIIEKVRRRKPNRFPNLHEWLGQPEPDAPMFHELFLAEMGGHCR